MTTLYCAFAAHCCNGSRARNQRCSCDRHFNQSFPGTFYVTRLSNLQWYKLRLYIRRHRRLQSVATATRSSVTKRYMFRSTAYESIHSTHFLSTIFSLASAIRYYVASVYKCHSNYFNFAGIVGQYCKGQDVRNCNGQKCTVSSIESIILNLTWQLTSQHRLLATTILSLHLLRIAVSSITSLKYTITN